MTASGLPGSELPGSELLEGAPLPPAPGQDGWVDALPQAVLLTEGGLVRRVNAAAVRLWGVPQERAAGRPVLEVHDLLLSSDK